MKGVLNVTDEQIVRLYLDRDEAAIQNTSAKYGSRLYSLANNILMDHASAEECENDTYYRAWNSIPPHEPKSYLFAFLARITRNLALDRCRSSSRQKRSAELINLSTELEQCIASPNDTECSVDRIVLADTISIFLTQLSRERRNVFLRRYWYMDSIKQIAKRYSISESKVKSALFRTRKELKGFLEKERFIL